MSTNWPDQQAISQSEGGALPPGWDESPAFFVGKKHRIWLRRSVGLFGPTIASILHNPSIADAQRSDPTTTRMIKFAESWPASDYVQTNAVTYVATDANDIPSPEDLFCPEADLAIIRAADLAFSSGGIVVAAWGCPKGSKLVREALRERFNSIIKLGIPMHAFRITSEGYPEHPLYLPRDLRPEPWMNF